MAPTIASVHGKVRAFVEGLTRLSRSARAAVPHGHFARDYNTLRKLALEAAPGLDERLLGKFIGVYETPAGEFSQAGYVEIEVYARQIVEQLALLLSSPVACPVGAASLTGAVAVPAKAYDIAVIRREHNQAYAPWSERDDEYLRARYLEGATLEDLVSEFGRQPGGIRSRLRKLGLGAPSGLADATSQDYQAERAAVAGGPGSESEQSVPEWRQLRPRAGRVWSQEEDAALLRDLEAGLPLEEIARRRDRGVFAVEVRLSKLGKGVTPGREGPAEQTAAADAARDVAPPDSSPTHEGRASERSR